MGVKGIGKERNFPGNQLYKTLKGLIMKKEAKHIYDSFLNTLSVKDLQDIYDEEMEDIEETEYLHATLLGLTESQQKYYQDLKYNLSVFDILEQRAEQTVFNNTYIP